MNANH